MNIIAGFILLLNTATSIGITIGYLRTKIQIATFYEMIEKLVLANNIDRAIKLCNSVPDALAAKTMKRLLLLANRPHELELCFQEVLLEYSMGSYKKKVLTVELASNTVTLLSWIVMLVTIMIYEHDWFTTICIGGTACCFLVTMSILNSLKQNLTEIMTYSLRLKNLLLNKAGYVPPQYRSVPMTETEITQWRERMEQFNESTASARAAGETRPAHRLYDEKADSNGVLPEL